MIRRTGPSSPGRCSRRWRSSASLALRSLPALFEPLSFQTTDRLFELRSRFPSLRPKLDDALVLIDVDDQSLKQIGTFYLGREDEARLVRNLGRAGVAAQAHDVIYAAPLPGDEALLEATDRRRKRLLTAWRSDCRTEARRQVAPGAIPERDRWRPRILGDASTPLRRDASVRDVSRARGRARGLGFLDIRVDRDGVYRLAPLLGRDGDALVPSLPLRVVCDYLGRDGRIASRSRRGAPSRCAARGGPGTRRRATS